MLDIRLIRHEPDAVRAALARRGPDAVAALDRLLEVDERWRAIRTELEELQAERNRASKGRREPPTPEEREQLSELAERSRALGEEERTLAPSARRARLAAQPPRPRRPR